MDGPATAGYTRPMERFGPYAITAVVDDQDPYIAVYRATAEDGTSVLLRVLQQTIDKEGDEYQRFRHEYRTLNQLRSPSVARVVDSGVFEGKVFYAVAAGRISRPLEEFLRSRSHRFTWQEAVDIGRQVAEGVAHMNSHGVLHRDIRATSVYYDPSTGEALIAEFNLVRNFQLESLTLQGIQRMALPVVTPEGSREEPYTVQTDVYLVGNLIHELVQGKAKPRYTFVYRPLRELGHEVPVELDELLARALSEEPAERFLTCGELARGLRSLATLRSA